MKNALPIIFWKSKGNTGNRKHKKTSCDHLPECVSLFGSSALVNKDHKLNTKASQEKELQVLQDC